MKTKAICSFLFRLLLVFLPFELAGCSSSPSDPAGSTYTPSTDIYTKPIDAARMVSYTENDVTYHFVDNQILVFLEDISMNEDLVATVAATADGTVVGHIPDIGMIQLETASLSVDEMALTIESLEGITGITAAFPNLMRQVDADDSCRRSGDLALNLPADAEAPERCAYEYPDFFNLLPVMRKLRSMGLLSPVKVAVIDMHFQGLNGQFNQAKISRLGSLPGSYYDKEFPHGFWVTGILAADDDGQSLAGILPSALGADGFELFIGDVKAEFIGTKWGLDFAGSWDLLVRAARDAKVDVVNISSGTDCNANSVFKCLSVISTDLSIINRFPDTLFVFSAGNKGAGAEGKEITFSNRTPISGLGVNNLIVVAGTISCDPLIKHPESNYGEGSVDVAAPYQVPILSASAPSQSWIIDEGGTSYSAPLVTGLAAILKAVHPKLTSSEIKDYIINNGGPTAVGLGVFINYTRPIILLAQVVHEGNAELQNLLNRNVEPFEPVDPMAHVINRICGSFSLNVETIGSFLLDSGRTEQVAATISGASGLSLGLIKDDAEPPAGQMSFLLNLSETFQLDYSYGLPDGAVSFAYSATDQTVTTGSCTQGSIIFKSCLITQRDHQYRPFSLEIEGVMSGTLELAELFSDPRAVFFDSTFTMTAAIQGVSESDPLWRVLESQCIGSINP